MTRDRGSRHSRSPLEQVLARLELRILTGEEGRRVFEPFGRQGAIAAKAAIAFDRKTRRLLYIEQARERSTAPDLQRTLSKLQRLVATPAFVPWLLLIKDDRAGLLYVHSHESQVPELRRWLERHSLYGRLPATDGTEAVRVPAIVDASPR